METYKCGHKKRPVFVNNMTEVFIVHRLWLDQKDTPKKCFSCFCQELQESVKESKQNDDKEQEVK